MEDKKLLIELNKYIQDEDMPTVKSLIESHTKAIRADEINRFLIHSNKGEGICVCQLADTRVCDHNWSLCNEMRERYKELTGVESTIDKDTKE